MKRIVYSGMACAGAALCATTISIAVGQPPVGPGGGKVVEITRPRQPGGYFGEIGKYLTIEGVRSEAVKIQDGTLVVDTVNGKKLEQPIQTEVRVHGFDASRYTLPTNFVMRFKHRYVFKGFESGDMIGVPQGVRDAAKELKRNDVPMSPVNWQWRPHFVALVVVEPKSLDIPKRNTP